MTYKLWFKGATQSLQEQKYNFKCDMDFHVRGAENFKRSKTCQIDSDAVAAFVILAHVLNMHFD